MPFAIGDEEVKFAGYGVMIVTLAAKRYRCPQCAGELRLTREIETSGQMLPAKFVCEKCQGELPAVPDLESGSVFPNLFKVDPNIEGTRTGRMGTQEPQGPHRAKPKYTSGGYGGGWQ